MTRHPLHPLNQYEAEQVKMVEEARQRQLDFKKRCEAADVNYDELVKSIEEDDFGLPHL